MTPADAGDDGDDGVDGDDGAAPVTSSSSVRVRDEPAGNRRDKVATIELIVASSLVLATLLGGAYVAVRPGSVAVDGWFLRVIAGSDSSIFTDATSLRYPAVVIVGSIVACGVTVRRDRPRAVACLIGPPLALLTCELMIKPLVGRTLGGAFSYPSGSTAGAAALAAAAVLATPARWRVATVAVGMAYALWMTLAVIALRLHYPTDALAGLAWGVGLVLGADGLAWWIVEGVRRVRTHLRPQDRDAGGSGSVSSAEARMMAMVLAGLSGSNLRSMGPSGSAGSPGASMTNGGFSFGATRACWSPMAMPVITAPVADRLRQLSNRSGSLEGGASTPSHSSSESSVSPARTGPVTSSMHPTVPSSPVCGSHRRSLPAGVDPTVAPRPEPPKPPVS